MEDCLFCNIAAGKIPSDIVYEDDRILCFRDIHPQAPVHVLVIPRVHIASAADITEENCEIVAHIFACIPEIVRMLGLTDGFRIISNCGTDACQSVQHLHFHILGGRQLKDHMG